MGAKGLPGWQVGLKRWVEEVEYGCANRRTQSYKTQTRSCCKQNGELVIVEQTDQSGPDQRVRVVRNERCRCARAFSQALSKFWDLVRAVLLEVVPGLVGGKKGIGRKWLRWCASGWIRGSRRTWASGCREARISGRRSSCRRYLGGFLGYVRNIAPGFWYRLSGLRRPAEAERYSLKIKLQNMCVCPGLKLAMDVPEKSWSTPGLGLLILCSSKEISSCGNSFLFSS